MNNTQLILSFIPIWSIFLTACLSPGPNTVLVISSALSSGRKTMFLVVLGLTIGGMVWAFLSVFAISQIITVLPILTKILAILGAGYLFYLGFRTLRGVIARVTKNEVVCVAKAHSPHYKAGYEAILAGLITTLSNPKVCLLWIALSPMVTIPEKKSLAFILFLLGIAFIIFLVYGTIGWLFSTNTTQSIYQKYVNWADTLFSIIFISLSGYIFTQFI